jgi:hypothetical protein
MLFLGYKRGPAKETGCKGSPVAPQRKAEYARAPPVLNALRVMPQAKRAREALETSSKLEMRAK